MPETEPSLWTAEEVYDTQIAPLMTQIIEVCRKHEIPLLAVFQYENAEEAGPGFVTTSLPNARQAPELRGLMDVWARSRESQHVAIAETITTLPDGSKHIKMQLIR